MKTSLTLLPLILAACGSGNTEVYPDEGTCKGFVITWLDASSAELVASREPGKVYVFRPLEASTLSTAEFDPSLTTADTCVRTLAAGRPYALTVLPPKP
jgi:hypothetical protein